MNSYVPANIAGLSGGSLLGANEENIFTDITQPLTNIMYSSAGWNGVSRCYPTPPAQVFISGVPLPPNFIVGSPTEYYADGLCMIRSFRRQRFYSHHLVVTNENELGQFDFVPHFKSNFTTIHNSIVLNACGAN